MHEKLSESIRALRAHYGDTQTVFAARLGVTGPAVTRYERGRTPKSPVLASLIDLAQQVGLKDLAKQFSEARVKAQGFESIADLAGRLGKENAAARARNLDAHPDVREALTAAIAVHQREELQLFLMMWREPQRYRDEIGAWNMISESIIRKVTTVPRKVTK